MFKKYKMPEPQFKRNIAYKFRIGDILSGSPVMRGERFGFLELRNKKVVRVNVIGSIVDKFESSGESSYTFLTLDDGTGQIKLKSFGDEVEKIKNVTHGQTVIVIGNVRYFNNEIYISPEIVKEQDPKYLVLRKIELEKSQEDLTGSEASQDFSSNVSVVPKPVQVEEEKTSVEKSLRDKITEMIKNSESQEGVDTEKLIADLGGSSEIINSEIQKLLEEGVIFEPRPGKIRWLG
tara:strand:+ start:632 stop:1336 length:705 start_codon:yes stop_codon:yes gene_type:complete